MNESCQKRSLNIKNDDYSKLPNESSFVESSIKEKKSTLKISKKIEAKELVKNILF